MLYSPLQSLCILCTVKTKRKTIMMATRRLTIFPHFACLPTEIHTVIWQHAFPGDLCSITCGIEVGSSKPIRIAPTALFGILTDLHASIATYRQQTVSAGSTKSSERTRHTLDPKAQNAVRGFLHARHDRMFENVAF